MYSIKKYTLAVSALLLLHAQSYAMEKVADQSTPTDVSLQAQQALMEKLSYFTKRFIEDQETMRLFSSNVYYGRTANLTEVDYKAQKASYVRVIEDTNAMIEARQKYAFSLHILEFDWLRSSYSHPLDGEWRDPKIALLQDFEGFSSSVSLELIEEFYKIIRDLERAILGSGLPQKERAKSAYTFYILEKQKASGADIAELVRTAKRMK